MHRPGRPKPTEAMLPTSRAPPGHRRPIGARPGRARCRSPGSACSQKNMNVRFREVLEQRLVCGGSRARRVDPALRRRRRTAARAATGATSARPIARARSVTPLAESAHRVAVFLTGGQEVSDSQEKCRERERERVNGGACTRKLHSKRSNGANGDNGGPGLSTVPRRARVPRARVGRRLRERPTRSCGLPFPRLPPHSPAGPPARRRRRTCTGGGTHFVHSVGSVAPFEIRVLFFLKLRPLQLCVVLLLLTSSTPVPINHQSMLKTRTARRIALAAPDRLGCCPAEIRVGRRQRRE